jgi:outer membrane murein-binding lipoprotein Lpp/YHS domain-containing protein
MYYGRKRAWRLSAAVLGAALLAGCASENTTSPDTGVQAQGDWKQGLDEDVVAALSELSEADREAALAQKTCPVGEQPLGSMGKPPKVTVNGQEVFLCCEGCEEDLRSDPEKYLAKLQKE